MISNYLYLISIGLAFMTIIFIIYNYILLNKNNKASHIESDKKEIIAKKYRNNILVFVAILVISISFILYYSRTVNIYKTVGKGENINYESVKIYGNATSGDIVKLDSEKGEEVFNLLEKYKYKRIFNFSDVTGDVEFISFENIEGGFGTIEVRSSGYIRIPNDKLYKVEAEDKEALYIELSKLLKNLK
ncbi:MAG: hypothetical protein E7212_06950 [Clostridium sartagoforme]|nr:hypothetical protein [Clostridium sartagoforme]